MKRILTVLLVLILLLAASPSVFADKQTVTGTYFEDMLAYEELSYSMEMDTDWFANASSEYNHNIARLSLLMTISAFKSENLNLKEKDANIKAFFKDAGFESFEDYDYDITPTRDTVANSFAMRRLHDSKGDYVLIAVPICGSGYGNEWVSNFTVGDTDHHTGFATSALKVYERLEEYIKKYASGERIKLWISGFSRSAAISNDLGYIVLESGDYNPDDVFVYAYATPNNTKNPAAYPQIFNICNGFDVVPKIPLYEWGYNKHGKTLYLPTPSTTSNYEEMAEAAEEFYFKLIGNNDEKISLPERNLITGYLVDLINRAIPNNDVYASGYQEAIANAWECEGTVGDKINAFIYTAVKNNCDTSGFEKISYEVENLLTASLNYSAEVVMGENDNSAWAKVLTEGKMLVHEHTAPVYMSWMFSCDDPEVLFGSSPIYTRIGYIGNTNTRVAVIDSKTKEETVVHDTANGMIKYPVVQLYNAEYIDLPSGKQYKVYITPTDDKPVRAFADVRTLPSVTSNYTITKATTLFEDEYLEINVPANPNNSSDVYTQLNGRLPVRMEKIDSASLEQKMIENVSGDDSSFKSMIFRILSYIPDVLGMLVVIIAILIIIFERFFKGPSNVYVTCSTGGLILFILTAALSLGFFIYITWTNIQYYIATSVNPDGNLLQRVGDYLKIFLMIYGIGVSVCQILMFVLSIKGINHKLSRHRLFVLSIFILVSTIISLLVVKTQDDIDRLSIWYSFVPILAIVAIHVADADCTTYVKPPKEKKKNTPE